MTTTEKIDDNGKLLARALHYLDRIDARLDALEQHHVALAAAYALLASPPEDAPRQGAKPPRRGF